MFSSSRISILARRVIYQMLADPRTLILIVIVPIVLLTVAGILIRVEPKDIQVGVVNHDEGMGAINLGSQLLTVLQGFDTFKTVEMTEQEADKKLDAGEVDAVITLRTDFTTQVAQTQTLTLHVTYEGSNPTISKRLETLFERAAAQAMTGLITANQETPRTIEAQIDSAYLYGGPEYDTLDYTAPALIAVFVFLFVFILTSISFLRERQNGTLERLQATPIRAHEIILGYMFGFLAFALIQGAITLLYTVFVLDIHYEGNLLNVFVVEIILAITSVNLGIFFSTFARNEFQVLQFIPLVVVSQVFLGGVLWEIDSMPAWLQPIAQLMPLTHANTALREIMIKGMSLSSEWGSITALIAIAAFVVLLSTRTARQVQI
ncbi:MAG: ABC transporter permease [Anaerolineae bacterium]|nr:ABC transporter permease [Anaerolineae bacterium]